MNISMTAPVTQRITTTYPNGGREVEERNQNGYVNGYCEDVEAADPVTIAKEEQSLPLASLPQEIEDFGIKRMCVFFTDKSGFEEVAPRCGIAYDPLPDWISTETQQFLDAYKSIIKTKKGTGLATELKAYKKQLESLSKIATPAAAYYPGNKYVDLIKYLSDK
ncbi:MAG: hypothetical protein PHH14_00705 [Candidatus Margulisbacteria bacterium]|nr:hypothetical protein [Candidatus Margulisiibacteriota bacterium]